MHSKEYISFVFFFIVTLVQAQHQISINASLVPESKSIVIEQELVYENNSDSTLTEIYLNDWANSFSSKTTPLAKRFAENYQASFHFENNKNRGHTKILKINNSLNVSLDSNSEFDRDFANKINSAIPIKATIVITYLNLIYLC